MELLVDQSRHGQEKLVGGVLSEKLSEWSESELLEEVQKGGRRGSLVPFIFGDLGISHYQPQSLNESPLRKVFTHPSSTGFCC